MSNIDTVIEKMGLRGMTSPNLAVVTTSEYIDARGADIVPKLLKELGVEAPDHQVEADIMLKSVIEQIITGQFTDVVAATAYGHQKIADIRRKMPFVFVVGDPVLDETGEVIQKRSKGDKNTKNADSAKLVKKMVDEGITDRGVITNALATELDTDYAGAYFYVKKAEKSLGITLTAQRGRKATKKKEM